MKKYCNNKELLEVLKSKNLKIKDESFASKSITKYSYYSIINTYKLIFKDDSGNYKNNSTFEEIFAIYKFDKTLKNIFLKYILEIESIMKAQIGEVFSRKYGIKDYLDRNNFDISLDRKSGKNNIQELIDYINDEIKKCNGKHDAITHYITNYGYVPPFVLVKILTIGALSKFYGLMKQDDRQEIAKIFNLSDSHLKTILGTLTVIRNIAAHDNRLYTYRNTFFININKIYNKPIIKMNKKTMYTNIFITILAMKFLLEDDDYNNFVNELKSEFKKLEKELTSITVQDVLNVMGFPKNYKL